MTVTGLLFLFPILAIPLSAEPLTKADHQDLYRTEYFHAVHKKLQNARESIWGEAG